MNSAASDLLGFNGDKAAGEVCWRLLGGTDGGGNQFCRPKCPLLRAALRQKALPRFTVKFRTACGKNIPINVSALVFYQSTSPREPIIVHLLGSLRPSGDLADTAEVADALVATAVLPSIMERGMLTSRELEILRLMSEGVRSDKIARRLFISVLTVRTHIQRILAKLGAHSKLEAIALAYSRRLL